MGVLRESLPAPRIPAHRTDMPCVGPFGIVLPDVSHGCEIDACQVGHGWVRLWGRSILDIK